MDILAAGMEPGPCRRCRSERVVRYKVEASVHVPPLGTPHLLVFPEIVACPDCRLMICELSKDELLRPTNIALSDPPHSA